MKPIEDTQNYKMVKDALDKISSDEWSAASAWYFCQSGSGGYFKDDKYAYIFTDAQGKGVWFSYRYGKAYPCKIRNIMFESFMKNLERGEEHGIFKRQGIENHVIAVDIETGKILSGN